MICSTCHTTVEVVEAPCPACGCPPGAVVEGSLAESSGQAAIPLELPADIPTGAASKQIGTLAPAPVRARPTQVVLAALPRFPALLWRQPVVRAAVRTGASAIALSLAVRMAERVLADRGARSAIPDDHLPPLARWLEPSSPARGPRRRRRGSAEVTETLIYIRRVSGD